MSADGTEHVLETHKEEPDAESREDADKAQAQDYDSPLISLKSKHDGYPFSGHEHHPMSPDRPASPGRPIYRPDTAYSQPPAAIMASHGSVGEGQLLYQIGEQSTMHVSHPDLIQNSDQQSLTC